MKYYNHSRNPPSCPPAPICSRSECHQQPTLEDCHEWLCRRPCPELDGDMWGHCLIVEARLPPGMDFPRFYCLRAKPRSSTMDKGKSAIVDAVLHKHDGTQRCMTRSRVCMTQRRGVHSKPVLHTCQFSLWYLEHIYHETTKM